MAGIGDFYFPCLIQFFYCPCDPLFKTVRQYPGKRTPKGKSGGLDCVYCSGGKCPLYVFTLAIACKPSPVIDRVGKAPALNPLYTMTAAANIDKLYSNAIEPWGFELNPNKDNTGLKARRYLYAPMEYGGKIAVVKITVKEYADADLCNKLYSIEAVDVDLGA